MKTARKLTAIILFGISGLQAQVRMESLTVADGLSQGFVTSIIQDNQGFIWMGTFDGLNRYDGYTVRQFKPKPFDSLSIQASFINCLFQDKNNIIWVGTTEGLYLFDPQKERFFCFGKNNAVFNGSHIVQITGDRDNNIFIQVFLEESPSKIYKIHTPAGIAKTIAENKDPIPGIQFQEITSAIPMANKVILFPCIGDSMVLVNNRDNSVLRYNYQDNQFQVFDIGTLPSNHTVDHSILWSNDCGFIFRWKLPDGRDSIIPVDYWAFALRLGNGRTGAWIFPKGLLVEIKLNKPISGDLRILLSPSDHHDLDIEQYTVLYSEAKEPIKFSFAYNKLMVDRSGIVWLGTGGLGVRKVNPNQAVFGSFLTGKSISSVREMPDNLMWARLYNDSSWAFNAQTGQIVTDPWIKAWGHIRLHEVYISRDNTYWGVEARGDGIDNQIIVRYFEPKSGFHFQFSEKLPFLNGVPEKIIEDREGNIWICAHKCQLFRCRPGKKSLELFSYAQLLPSNIQANLRTTSVTQDATGNLWIGTNQGMILVENSNGASPRFSLFQHDDKNPKSISIDWVTSILPDKNDRDLLWIGTRGGGLNRMHIPSQTFTFWTEAPNELPNNVVYGILPDDFGNLWCSTNRGIFRFSPTDNSFTAYQEADGLSSTEFNTNSYLRTSDGRLWFGGVNGLNFFRPEEMRVKKTAPDVAITGIYIHGQMRYPDKKGSLSLPFEENNVLFEFAALDFTNPATNHFRHRLKGIDRGWVYDGVSHSVNYSALPPGRYVFELQGATADSPWSAESVVFILEIRAPWYRSWLAIAFYVMLGCAAIYAYSRYRVQVFKLRNKAKLNQLESERLKAFEAIKNEFFANVAHELRTPLTVILGLANRLSRPDTTDSVQGTAQQIIRQGDQLLSLTNQVLDLARLESNQFQLQAEKGNIIGLIQQHVENLRPLAASKGHQLVTQIDKQQLWVEYDQKQVQKILNNLISNAIRHTPPGGTITVKAQKEPDGKCLKISVSDTGEGIAVEDLPHVFDRFFQSGHAHSDVGSSGIGLTLTRDLVQLMGGRIEVDSQIGKGATFTIFLPINELDPPAAINAHNVPAKAYDQAAKPETSKLPRLLVIEDNPDVSAYLRLCLQPHFRLKMASDGEMGILMAIELMPDIILTDVAMPFKTGYEVVTTLKSDVRSSHIPIVMLTAKVEHEDRLEGHRRGANAYLTKPFDEAELLMVLHNLLQLQQQWKNRYEGVLSGTQKLPLVENGNEEQQNEDAFILHIRELFEANFSDDTFNLDRLCQLLNMSSSQLDRKLKVLTDQSPMLMLRTFRLQKAREILSAERHVSIKELCFRTGFKNPSHFSRLYSKEFGTPPSAG